MIAHGKKDIFQKQSKGKGPQTGHRECLMSLQDLMAGSSEPMTGTEMEEAGRSKLQRGARAEASRSSWPHRNPEKIVACSSEAIRLCSV